MEATKRIGSTLGQDLQARRRLIGLSMKKLAQEIGVCEKTIHNWENDECCFPVDKLMPMCRALRWTPSDLLRIDSDIDAGIKFQEARRLCEIIRGITARLRNIPDLTEARPLLAERDRLRNLLAELFDLPPLQGDFAAELARTEQWNQQKQSGWSGKIFMQYVSACWPAADAARAGA
jgi:DNA-binding XRE family transcriptional regulator